MVKILIADSENLEIEALKLIIQRKFKEVKVIATANCSDELIEKVEYINPDIIFIDMLIYGLNSFDVIRYIKKTYVNKKIVIMSIYDDFYFVRKALKLKVDDYLLKPIKVENVVEILNEFINIDKDYSINNELKFVLNYIEKNLKGNIMLQDIASCMNVSTSYLSKSFKNKMGTNFNKYVTKRKIEEAKYILKSTDISISDLTFNIGYNEPNYFCKVFKKVEGMTPLEYRELYKNK
ncbi:response regulator transcription factor [Clostridium septicum]|uniref:Stage 0 sporulation protein A homolog n=1 Tax=Clostridium septicum TaxID=1504 RepID=A0A9N7PHQ5_CLOSE|nr:helix-turn-helix domain-containing protein [Clostridium septicum]AYE33030.1 AraC family transcriptional regulator [Clostridium septicum]QAS61199.1 AraC family transcriptional regulator [Clostridium septicum]UEC19451.1 helix-turn-helix domain-containing protein [Clostridium septicum]USR99596.1 helix-turn-helix domain-containing protein [Clostridium septicum]